MGASNKDKDAEQFSYLPVTCPGCGREGKVNISRLDHTFTCMQCRRVFHLSLQGSVLGERFEPIEVDPYVVSSPPSSPLIRWLEQLPRSAWWGAGGAAGAVVALALVWLLFFSGGDALPESLDDRPGSWPTPSRKPNTAGSRRSCRRALLLRGGMGAERPAGGLAAGTAA